MARVLWVSNETPDSKGQGGQRRQFFQLREVVGRGHEVTLCTLAGSQSDAEVRQHAHVIRTSTRWRGRVPRIGHPLLLRRLAQERWDAAVVAHTESWPTFRGAIREGPTPSWVDLHNVLGRDVDGLRTRWDDMERQICAEASVVSVCSEQERERLLSQQPDDEARVVVMNHGLDPHEWDELRSPRARPVVKLFGNWQWDPNRRGLHWFLTEVWPRVNIEEARCEIAGTGAVIPSSCGRTVTFVGRVPSVSQWAGDAWAVAVPVINGVGAPVKYLEALATRAPVLSTPDGAPMARNDAALVSDDATKWTQTLRRLLGGSGPPADTGVNPTMFSWENATAPLLQWLEDF
ncbi:glycosyltransferase family 4 protein [Ornithinimicrobium ciconiae]|uniref:Glycosyltransferase family 4 protein n=1 Tax=Ornithinimicrobium ciconiae TaxID=2594265 RepID=A0A516G7D9_9MICO|nr:glycosyltransferase family 4 protein [Ornithinimicrobium ciconiae]